MTTLKNPQNLVNLGAHYGDDYRTEERQHLDNGVTIGSTSAEWLFRNLLHILRDDLLLNHQTTEYFNKNID